MTSHYIGHDFRTTKLQDKNTWRAVLNKQVNFCFKYNVNVTKMLPVPGDVAIMTLIGSTKLDSEIYVELNYDSSFYLVKLQRCAKNEIKLHEKNFCLNFRINEFVKLQKFEFATHARWNHTPRPLFQMPRFSGNDTLDVNLLYSHMLHANRDYRGPLMNLEYCTALCRTNCTYAMSEQDNLQSFDAYCIARNAQHFPPIDETTNSDNDLNNNAQNASFRFSDFKPLKPTASFLAYERQLYYKKHHMDALSTLKHWLKTTMPDNLAYTLKVNTGWYKKDGSTEDTNLYAAPSSVIYKQDGQIVGIGFISILEHYKTPKQKISPRTVEKIKKMLTVLNVKICFYVSWTKNGCNIIKYDKDNTNSQSIHPTLSYMHKQYITPRVDEDTDREHAVRDIIKWSRVREWKRKLKEINESGGGSLTIASHLLNNVVVLDVATFMIALYVYLCSDRYWNVILVEDNRLARAVNNLRNNSTHLHRQAKKYKVSVP